MSVSMQTKGSENALWQLKCVDQLCTQECRASEVFRSGRWQGLKDQAPVSCWTWTANILAEQKAGHLSGLGIIVKNHRCLLNTEATGDSQRGIVPDFHAWETPEGAASVHDTPTCQVSAVFWFCLSVSHYWGENQFLESRIGSWKS